MGNRPRTPGADEVIVSPPWGQRHCARLEHTVASVPAWLVVTFGPLGAHGRTSVFPGCSRRSYPLCLDCWRDTRLLAQTAWTGLLLAGPW